MIAQGQITGMRGVYLVAAELANLGFIASPTSRSAIGADILVTDQSCSRAFSVQVKTNSRTFYSWLLSKKAAKINSSTHIYVFVNIKAINGKDSIEYYVVPSRVVANNIRKVKRPNSTWYAFDLSKARKYKDKWSIFGKAG